MSDIIQLLPDHVANQIAAGEVVQRPASVVKELLENAIDAGSETITLLLKNAGKTLIQVIDDGKGMTHADARLCFERHATSKIKDAKDLFNLHTKGFRGEALASISAVAHVELKTKQESSELGIAIKNEGNVIVSDVQVQTIKGTSIAVKNLFFNIPARRNFLKSDNIETRHIIDEFQRVAMAHSDISFIFYHNDKEIYNLKSGIIKHRIIAIFGRKMDLKLVPIQEQTDILTVQGYVSKPEFSKKKRGEQFFFVNDRFIKSPYLHNAIVNAFDNLLEKGSYPSYFLYLTVPASSIDINIHPTKTEIKFDNDSAIYAMLRATIKHSLGQYNAAPVLDFNRDASLDVPYEYKDKVASKPKISVDHNFNPFKEDYEQNQPAVEINSGTLNKQYISNVNDTSDSWESLYSNIDAIESVSEPTQETFFKSSKDQESGKTFQLQQKYIIATIRSGIVMIHQSLAHQRVLYDEFIAKIKDKKGNSQQLLFPVTINFQKEDIGTIYSVKSELENTGFVFNEFTMDSIVIGGIPDVIKESEASVILEQLLEDLSMEIPDSNFDYAAKMALSFAKSVCIKTGKKLSAIEQESLVSDLFSSTEPSVSPDGKLIIKTLTLNDIDAIFNN